MSFKTASRLDLMAPLAREGIERETPETKRLPRRRQARQRPTPKVFERDGVRQDHKRSPPALKASIRPHALAFAKAGISARVVAQGRRLDRTRHQQAFADTETPTQDEPLKSTNVVGTVGTSGCALSSPHDRPVHASGFERPGAPQPFGIGLRRRPRRERHRDDPRGLAKTRRPE